MRGSRVLEALSRLRASLDAVAAALASPDVSALIAAESNLALAVTEIGRMRGIDRADHNALGAELILASAALSRCRIFGAMATDATRMTLAAQGQSDSYGRSGATTSSGPLPGRDLNTRI
jgi:hypothetical protein